MMFMEQVAPPVPTCSLLQYVAPMMIFNSLPFFGLCSDFFLGYHNLGDLMAYFRNEVAGLF